MAMHARLADVATESALEARMRQKAALEVTEAALSDGVVTLAEARDMLAVQRRALEATERVVADTERANIGQKMALSFLTVVPVNPYLRKQAAEVGLPLDNLLLFPGPESNEVAYTTALTCGPRQRVSDSGKAR